MKSQGTDDDIETVLKPLKAWVKEYLDADDGKFIKRKEFAAGDVLIAPFLTRMFDHSKVGVGAGGEGSKALYKHLNTDPEFENLRAYYDKLSSWDGFKGTVNDPEKVVEKMKGFLNPSK